MRLKAGAPLLAAVGAGFADAGFSSGVIEIGALALGPFAYVMPALSKDGSHAAFYSDTFRPPGVTRFEGGALTYGSRDGAPFFHCHGIWREADGRRSGGHVLPEEAVLAEDCIVAACGLDGAAFTGDQDLETGFKLFGPVAVEPRGGDADRRAFALRVRPNQSLHSALENFAREAGLRDARIRGGVGSTIGALFEDGTEIGNFATEVFIAAGSISTSPDGRPTAEIEVGLVDFTGALAQGRLMRGANRTLMTFELALVEE